jgi:REP element-mobilizing transposase RayT
MARQWRIEYEGAFYHVLSRGIEQRDIFYDDADRHNFLDILGRMSERFNIDVYAYVLMNNHYHLLIKTNASNLSRSMQWLGTAYTTHFNLRHGRRGHLFQGRFKSIIVENDAYLIQLSYYIHRNPLRAGLVKRLAGYRWSSYPAYAYGKAQPSWLDTDFLLSQFNFRDKHKAYRERMQEYAREEKGIWEDVRHGLIFGSGEFVDRIKSTYLIGGPHKEIPQQRRILKK